MHQCLCALVHASRLHATAAEVCTTHCIQWVCCISSASAAGVRCKNGCQEAKYNLAQASIYKGAIIVNLPHCVCGYIWIHRTCGCEHPKLSACHMRPACTTSHYKAVRKKLGRNLETTLIGQSPSIKPANNQQLCSNNDLMAEEPPHLAAVVPEGCSNIITLLKFQQGQIK